MSNVLVRDLPDDIHGELQRRAAQAGQSLQQYLLTELGRMVQRPTVNDLLDRIETRSGGSVGFTQAVSDLAEGRERE